MRIFVVVGLYKGCLEDLKVFLDEGKAVKFYTEKMSKYGKDNENDLRLQAHNVSFEDTDFIRTADGENILYCLSEEDAQNVAGKESDKKLNTKELLQVQRKIELGLESCWHGVTEAAVEAVLEERGKNNDVTNKETETKTT